MNIPKEILSNYKTSIKILDWEEFLVRYLFIVCLLQPYISLVALFLTKSLITYCQIRVRIYIGYDATISFTKRSSYPIMYEKTNSKN